MCANTERGISISAEKGGVSSLPQRQSMWYLQLQNYILSGTRLGWIVVKVANARESFFFCHFSNMYSSTDTLFKTWNHTTWGQQVGGTTFLYMLA